jgi:peptidoglycan/LPS O-acetylase OafA/YrhL
VLLLTIALFLYTYKWTFHGISGIHNAYYDYSAIILGSCIFIISGISSKRIANFLSHPILVFFGNISFSLYLYHLVILLASLYMFNNLMPVWSILLLALLFTIMVSFLSYKYVETPSISYIKKLINSKK